MKKVICSTIFIFNLMAFAEEGAAQKDKKSEFELCQPYKEELLKMMEQKHISLMGEKLKPLMVEYFNKKQPGVDLKLEDVSIRASSSSILKDQVTIYVVPSYYLKTILFVEIEPTKATSIHHFAVVSRIFLKYPPDSVKWKKRDQKLVCSMGEQDVEAVVLNGKFTYPNRAWAVTVHQLFNDGTFYHLPIAATYDRGSIESEIILP